MFYLTCIAVCYSIHRMQLYCPFQSLMDHGYNVCSKLADEFFRRCQPEAVKGNSSESSRLIGLALSVGKSQNINFMVHTGTYTVFPVGGGGGGGAV